MKTYALPKSMQNSFAIQSGLTVALISLSVLMPVILHAILPGRGIEIGTAYLPMFYAAVFGAYLLNNKFVYVLSLAAPLTNFLLTGSPMPQILMLLTVEMVAFVFIIRLLQKNSTSIWFSAPAALIGAKLITSLAMVSGISLHPAFSGFEYFTNIFAVSYPGMIILLGLSFVLGYVDRSND